MTQNMFVEQKTSDQVMLHPSENEVLSHDLQSIVGHYVNKQHIYLKISFGKKHLYREFIADSNMKGNDIALGYRTLKELGINIKENAETPQTVVVSETCWLAFAAINSDASIKAPFWIGLTSLIIAIISFFN